MAFDFVQEMDHVVTDPVVLDPAFPPEHFVTHYRVDGQVVHASLWTAQGRDPKPTLVLAPQMYGGDRLESLILPLMHSGMNVLTFHPRGMWDGIGQHTFTSALADVHAAVDLLRTAEEQEKVTPSGVGWRVDPSRIGVFGLSGGGATVGLVACAESDDLAFAIAMAPANFELMRDLGYLDRPDKEAAAALMNSETAGRVDTPRILRSMTPEDFDRLSVLAQAGRLARKKVLLVGASDDATLPIAHHHVPMVDALREAGARDLTEVVLDTDHMFLTKRIALARLVVSWLRTEVR